MTEETNEEIDKSKALFSSANQAFSSGSYARAEKMYTKAVGYLLESSALKSTILSNRSATRLKLNDFRGAEADAHEVSRINPCWPVGYERLGNAHMANNQLLEAWSAYMRALTLDRTNMNYKKTIAKIESSLKTDQLESLNKFKDKWSKTPERQFIPFTEVKGDDYEDDEPKAKRPLILAEDIVKAGLLKISLGSGNKRFKDSWVEVFKTGEVFASRDHIGTGRLMVLDLSKDARVIKSDKYENTVKLYGITRRPAKMRFKFDEEKDLEEWTQAIADVLGFDHKQEHVAEMQDIRARHDDALNAEKARLIGKLRAVKLGMKKINEQHKRDMVAMQQAAKRQTAEVRSLKAEIARLKSENEAFRATVGDDAAAIIDSKFAAAKSAGGTGGKFAPETEEDDDFEHHKCDL